MTSVPKLVRDKIPDIIQKSGKDCEFRTAAKKELSLLFLNKLQEEIHEFFNSPNVMEAADVYEVFLETLRYYSIDFSSVVNHAYYKRDEKGGFRRGIVLEIIKEKDSEDD